MFMKYEGGEAMGYMIVIFLFISVGYELIRGYYEGYNSVKRSSGEIEEECLQVNPNIEAEEIDI